MTTITALLVLIPPEHEQSETPHDPQRSDWSPSMALEIAVPMYRVAGCLAVRQLYHQNICACSDDGVLPVALG